MKHDDDDAIEDTKGKKTRHQTLAVTTTLENGARFWCVWPPVPPIQENREPSSSSSSSQKKKKKRNGQPMLCSGLLFLYAFQTQQRKDPSFEIYKSWPFSLSYITYTHSMALHNGGKPHVCWGKRAAAPQSWPMTDESYMATRHVRPCVLQPRRRI